MAEKINLENPKHADFLRTYLFEPIELLVDEFGDEEVHQALIKLLPGYPEDITLDEAISPMAILKLLGKGGKKVGGKGLKSMKGLAKWTGGALLGLGGAGMSMLGGAAARFAGKNIDQDVEIDGITTDDALNVTPKGDILKLITQSNKLLQAITQLLGANTKELGDMDDNFDDLLSVQTGLSKGAVKGRQATGAGDLEAPYPGLASSGLPGSSPDKKKPAAKK